MMLYRPVPTAIGTRFDCNPDSNTIASPLVNSNNSQASATVSLPLPVVAQCTVLGGKSGNDCPSPCAMSEASSNGVIVSLSSFATKSV